MCLGTMAAPVAEMEKMQVGDGPVVLDAALRNRAKKERKKKEPKPEAAKPGTGFALLVKAHCICGRLMWASHTCSWCQEGVQAGPVGQEGR